MTNKRQNTLKILEYFIPTNVTDWTRPHIMSSLGISNVIESHEGIDSEQAFFDYSERGVRATNVTNLNRFAELVSAQRWMAAHVKMWREGKSEGTLSLSDFDNEPEFIRVLVEKKVFS